MKATKEYRAWMKRLMKYHGKNGTIPGCLLDCPMERKIQSLKRDSKV